MEKLEEINKTELKSNDGYKYEIIAYDDVTTINYYELEKSKEVLKQTYDICSLHDIQIAEKIIELRKAFKD